MTLYEHPLYREDVERAAHTDLPWEKIEGTSILISGGCGLIGSFLIDVLMERNRLIREAASDRQAEPDGLIRIFAMGRSRARGEARFASYLGDPAFTFVERDVNEPLFEEGGASSDEDVSAEAGDALIAAFGRGGYVLHLASQTHPVAYATDPIGTIMTNITGTQHMLDFAVKTGAKRALFASSNEIYGQNRGDAEFFDESYCGYIDSNTLRAGYPESKRCGEALCQAYIRQRELDVVIARLTRSYGPTLLKTDTKAMSQFLGKAVAGEDIVLKSEGTQYFSYTYMADAVTGLLTVLLKGETGEAYNIADAASDIRLRDLAACIAEAAGTKVVFELPDAVESAGFSKATKARLAGDKIKALGWRMTYDIKSGTARTVGILKDLAGRE